MVELAEIFHRHGPAYRARFADRMLPSHRRAMGAIEQCRTEALGGQLYQCEQCHEPRYSYHSCKNRHCPKCQNDQAEQWLEKQTDLLLPITHFLVTFTLPAQLRSLARRHQQTVYNILFRTSAEALQELAADPRFVGARIGMVGVLHTWTRDLRYHPHVHYIVTGGGLTADDQWRYSRPDFLVPVKPLALLFRAKFRAALKQTDLFAQVAQGVWQTDWVVHCEPVGSGQAAFKYLTPYIFRVALSNRRILQLADGKVTFQYQDSATKQSRTATVAAQEFIRRFLQHVLPDRFIKVRYYGLLSPTNRPLLKRARELLAASTSESKPGAKGRGGKAPAQTRRCPKCGSPLRLVQPLSPRARWPP